jgi:hypothetical protein
MKRALAILLFLFPSVSFAANGWFSNPDCTGTVLTTLVRYAYFCADSAGTLNGFSNVLVTRGLRLEVTRIGDRTQSAAGTGEVRIFESAGTPGAAVTVSTGLPEISGDTTGDGIQDDNTLNGAANRRAIRGFYATGITIKLTTLPSGSEQLVIAVFGA